MAYGSFETDGMTVESSGHTSEELAANLTPVVDDTVVEEQADAPEKALVEPEEPKAKPRNDPKARMLDATAKEAAAKRERDEARTEAAALKARIAELEAKATPAPKLEPKAATEAEPTVDQFDTYEKFVDARARWAARQEWDARETARTTHEAQQREEHLQRAVNDGFEKRYSAIVAEDPEFQSRIMPSLVTAVRYGMLSAEDRKSASLGSIVMEEIFHSEHPKELLLHVSDPEVAQRLATLPPTKLRQELAKFDARLDAASPGGPAPIAPVSKAKRPIQPLGTSHVGADADEITGEESVDEHIRKANAADRRSRRAS